MPCGYQSWGQVAYQLGVELGEAWLAGIVKDEDGVDHGAVGARLQQIYCMVSNTVACAIWLDAPHRRPKVDHAED